MQAEKNVFWVPAEAPLEPAQAHAKQATTASSDDAMVAIERTNPRAQGVCRRIRQTASQAAPGGN